MLTLRPNAEKVVADYLRDQEDVLEITGGRRVSYETPDKTDTPWVRYAILDETDVSDSRTDYFTRAYIQFDCYAGKTGGQPEASLLARTVRAAIVAMPDSEDVSGAVVTATTIRGFARVPDTQLASRERFVVSALVYLRPESA